MTEYLGQVLTHNGYNGDMALIHLVRDTDTNLVLAVWEGGYYTYGLYSNGDIL